jgi:hypothetical protein
MSDLEPAVGEQLYSAKARFNDMLARVSAAYALANGDRAGFQSLLAMINAGHRAWCDQPQQLPPLLVNDITLDGQRVVFTTPEGEVGSVAPFPLV